MNYNNNHVTLSTVTPVYSGADYLQKLVEEKHKLPYLKLETEYSPSDTAQLKVRIQALIEMVKGRT